MRIRLTENQLHRVIKESVSRILKEDQGVWTQLKQQMKSRPDKEDIIQEIQNGNVEGTKIEIDGPGSCSVYVQTPDESWGEWIYVEVKNGDIDTDWCDIYMDDIKNDNDVFDQATSAALEYAEEKGVVVQGGNGEWHAGNINESRKRHI